MPNDQLFIDVLAQIERDPVRWDQGWWMRETVCGTTYCFAGWAAYLGGYTVRQDETEMNSAWASKRGVKRRRVQLVAAELLGVPSDFTEEDGDCDLFASGNDLDDLYELSADYLGLDEQVLRDKVQAEIGP